MNRKPIPVEEAAKVWNEDPAYRAAYDAMEGEFTRASAMIEARSAARTSQQRTAGSSALTPRPRRN